MADWKLEQLNLERTSIKLLSEGETGEGLAWVLTLTDAQDVFVFVGGPLLYQAAKLAIEYVGDAESPEAVKLFDVLSEAINKAEGVG